MKNTGPPSSQHRVEHPRFEPSSPTYQGVLSCGTNTVSVGSVAFCAPTQTQPSALWPCSWNSSKTVTRPPCYSTTCTSPACIRGCSAGLWKPAAWLTGATSSMPAPTAAQWPWPSPPARKLNFTMLTCSTLPCSIARPTPVGWLTLAACCNRERPSTRSRPLSSVPQNFWQTRAARMRLFSTAFINTN